MMEYNTNSKHSIGPFDATGFGIGAIVGGGILALAGAAFSAAGPGAAAALALNVFIAFLTMLSFAELSVLFPQSGGTYTFAKILSGKLPLRSDGLSGQLLSSPRSSKRWDSPPSYFTGAAARYSGKFLKFLGHHTYLSP